MKEVLFQELVGEHVLSGVDRENSHIKQTFGEDCEISDAINFVLDGKTYSACEDPCDDYRSSMRYLAETDYTVTNQFEGVRVIGLMQPDSTYEKNQVLQLFDVKTGKIVLEVGTSNTDDYYPRWVASFNPENMVLNAQ